MFYKYFKNNYCRNTFREFGNFIGNQQKQLCFVVIVSEKLLKNTVDQSPILHRNTKSIPSTLLVSQPSNYLHGAHQRQSLTDLPAQQFFSVSLPAIFTKFLAMFWRVHVYNAAINYNHFHILWCVIACIFCK